MTEIPEADQVKPTRTVLPLLYCVHMGVSLGATVLAIWVPMLADIVKHRWRETKREELEALLDEVLAALWQVQEKFPDIEVTSARETLIRIRDNLRDALGIPFTPTNEALLDRRAGCEEAKQRFETLAKQSSDDVLLNRHAEIKRALEQILRGDDLDAGAETNAGEQQAILGAVLISFGLSVKARAEESFLTSELDPSAYESYRRRVPMLIPFLPHR